MRRTRWDGSRTRCTAPVPSRGSGGAGSGGLRSPPHSGNCPAPGTPSFAVGCPGSDPGRHHHGVLAGGSSIAGLFADDHTWIWAVSKYLSTRGLPTRLLPTVHRLMPSVLPLFETTLESTPTDLASDFTRRTGATYSVLSSGFMNACCPS